VPEINPAFALQNAGSTHTANNDRMMLSALMAGQAAALTGRGGVSRMGSSLAVQPQGSPNMTVNVLSGHVFIPGSESVSQGVYSCTNTSTVVLAIATAHASLPRIDIVVAKVQDSAFSGATDAWSLVVVTGTAAASPVAPTAPANSITLAQISVGAGVTSITGGNIADTRFYVAATGGIIPCTSTLRPSTSVVPIGQFIYETDTGRTWVRNPNGAFWPISTLYAYKTADETLASSITNQNDDHLLLPVDINATYVFKLHLNFSANNAVDFKFDFTLPAGASFAINSANAIMTWPAATNNLVAMAPGSSQNLDGGNSNTPTLLWGSFSTVGTAGFIQFRWSQQVSSALVNTVYKGSWLEVTRVA
jgi:hypothetical protein